MTTNEIPCIKVIALCDFFANIFGFYQDQSDFNQFSNMITKGTSFERFADLIYIKGQEARLYAKEFAKQEQQGRFAKQDELFDKWFDMCKQLKSMMEMEQDGVEFFYSVKSPKRIKIEEPNANLLNIIIAAQLDNLNEFEDIYYGPNKPHIIANSLDSINKRLAYGEAACKRIYEGKTKKVADPKQVTIHCIIQRLAILSKFDRFIKSDAKDIDSIELLKNDAIAIYHYLSFFELKALMQREENTTEPYDLIKSALSKFPKTEIIEGEKIKAIKKNICNFKNTICGNIQR